MIRFLNNHDLLSGLKDTDPQSQEFILLILGALSDKTKESVQVYLDECVRILRNGGLLFVQGEPSYLPEFGAYLDQKLRFKYWIAIESDIRFGRLCGMQCRSHGAR